MAVTLEKRGKSYFLDLGKSQARILSSKDAMSLIRSCVAMADNVFDADANLPPFVVAADLDYSDYGGDQDTRCYHWAVQTDDKKLAEQIRDAVKTELKGTTFEYSAHVRIPAVPELDLNIKHIACVALVEASLVDLRTVLVAHQSDSILYDEKYWLRFGFNADDQDFIKGVFDGLHGDYDCELAEVLEAYLQKHKKLDRAEKRAAAQLQQWVKGQHPPK